MVRYQQAHGQAGARRPARPYHSAMDFKGKKVIKFRTKGQPGTAQWQKDAEEALRKEMDREDARIANCHLLHDGYQTVTLRDNEVLLIDGGRCEVIK